MCVCMGVRFRKSAIIRCSSDSSHQKFVKSTRRGGSHTAMKRWQCQWQVRQAQDSKLCALPFKVQAIARFASAHTPTNINCYDKYKQLEIFCVCENVCVHMWARVTNWIRILFRIPDWIDLKLRIFSLHKANARE